MSLTLMEHLNGYSEPAAVELLLNPNNLNSYTVNLPNM